MAFNRPGGSFSFQQEQVAHPSPYSLDSNTTDANPSSLFFGNRSHSNHTPPSTQQPDSYQYPLTPNTGTVNPYSQPFVDAQFDIFEWHVQNQSCVRYFLDHAQYSAPVQAVAAFVNIQLPFQRPVHPVLSSKPRSSTPGTPNMGMSGPSSSSRAGAPAAAAQVQPGAFVTLVPYIRRLIATAFDFPAVLHGFFGDDWMAGIGPVLEAERRNYLFAAKSENWLKVKADYDMDESQTVPFLRPLQNVSEEEIENAEQKWSEWLAMQDWMLGPRAPGSVNRGPTIKREQE